MRRITSWESPGGGRPVRWIATLECGHTVEYTADDLAAATEHPLSSSSLACSTCAAGAPEIDGKGLALARAVRAAIKARDEDPDLRAALEVYDRAVTAVERQAAAAFLIEHSARAEDLYRRTVDRALLRAFKPELLPPEER